MAITAQLYIPDRGSVKINGTEQNGSVKTLSYNVPRKSERIVNSMGGSKTETQTREKAGNYEVSMSVLDDRSLLESAASTGIMLTLWEAYENNTELTSMVVIPAGVAIGMTGYTFGGSIHVVSCPPHADMDADTEDEAVSDVIVVTETVTPAAVA